MKKINLKDADIKSILEMHVKAGYKSSLLNEDSTLPGKDSNAVQDVIDRANKNAAGVDSSKHNKTGMRHILVNKEGKKVPVEIGTPLIVDVENGSVKIGDNFTFTCKPEFVIYSPTSSIPTVPSIVPQVQTPTVPTEKSSRSIPSYIVGKSGIRYIEFTKQPQPGTLITMMKKTYCDGNVLKKFPNKVTNKCLIQKPNPAGKIVSAVVNYYYNSKLDACEFGPPTPGAFTDKTICVKTCVKNQKTTDDTKKQDNKPKIDYIPKVVKLPDLTYKNYCELPGDKNWVYAKLDDGTWFASKVANKVDWYKLELPKFQKAVDLLNKDARCRGLEEIPVLKVKQAQQITNNNTQKDIISKSNKAPDQDNEERPV